MNNESRPRVLVLARNYPNNVLPTFGLWTRRLVHASKRAAQPTVVSPVPYVPPAVPIEAYARHRRVLHRRNEDGIEVHHPRVPAGPGYLLHSVDAQLIYPFLVRVTDRLHALRRFNLIHAHFIYPDGVMAARLGERYGIPVVTTEGAVWRPWLDNYPRVRKQVMDALPAINRVTAVSTTLRENIWDAVGERIEVDVVPNVVDANEFPAPSPDEPWDPNEILFVGLVRHVKGLDVLVRAFEYLRHRRPALRLTVLGAAFFRGHQKDEREVQQLVEELGLGDRIRFAGHADPPAVAAAMRRAALLVLPSRREAFGAVVIEALASGTPVVATRCGGPQDIITPRVGRLVPPEQPAALAQAIDEMLTLRPGFDRLGIRREVLSNFGVEPVANRLGAVYDSVLGGGTDSRDETVTA